VKIASHLLYLLALAALALPLTAPAALVEFNPGVPLKVLPASSNDGYSEGRGIWFRADQNLTVSGAGLYNGFGAGDAFTLSLWSANSTGTNLRSTLLGSFAVVPATVDGYQDGAFAAPINLVDDDFYHLEVTTNGSFDRKYYYNWDGPGVGIGGLVTILDGTQRASKTNTVAPALRINAISANAVPEPGSLALLAAALGAFGLSRRRKKA
jgi:hypothetical protein